MSVEEDNTSLAILETLLKEIKTAEDELGRLGGDKIGSNRSNIRLEAATLREEASLLSSNPVEGFVEDDKVRYFLAVGEIENVNDDLRRLKELNELTETENIESLASNQRQVHSLEAIIEGLKKEVEDYAATEKKEHLKRVNIEKRKALKENSRANKLILKELKSGLKDFLYDTERLSPNYESHDSSLGHLLQALWKNYKDNGVHNYISMESLDFDVEKNALEQVKRAGLIVQNSKNSDQIKLVDFTLQ